MRFSLLYNPFEVITRLAIEINRYKRRSKLRGTPAAKLNLGYLDTLEFFELMKSEKINVIYDIGANIGTWSLLAYSFFPKSRIYSFEPLKNHIATFQLTCANINTICLLPYCLGNKNDRLILNVSSFSDSSSLLDATPLVFEEYGIKKIKEEIVDVFKAETLISLKKIEIPQLIKLDVQGYELEILKGFGEYLHDVKYIICEVSFKEYYKQQPLFLEISNYLCSYDFQIHAFSSQTPLGFELGQIDILYKKRN